MATEILQNKASFLSKLLWGVIGIILGGLGIYFILSPENNTPQKQPQGGDAIAINTVTTVPVPCVGDKTGSITVDATSTTGGTLQFDWGSGWVNSNTLSNLGIGVYSYKIKSSNGALFNGNVTVTSVSDFSNVTIVINKFPSSGSSNDGELNAIPNGSSSTYTYVWNTSPVQTTQTVSNLKAGVYAVDVTDSKGCKITRSLNLIVRPSPQQVPLSSCNSNDPFIYWKRVRPSYYWSSHPVMELENIVNASDEIKIGHPSSPPSCTNWETVTFKGTGSGASIFYTLQQNFYPGPLLSTSLPLQNKDVPNPGISSEIPNNPPVGVVFRELLSLKLNLINCDIYLLPHPSFQFGDLIYNSYSGSKYDGMKVSAIFEKINDMMGGCPNLPYPPTDEFNTLSSINQLRYLSCN